MTSQLPGDHGPCARRHGADLHAGAEYAPLPSCTLRANSIAEQQGYGSVAIGLIAAARPSFAAQRRHHASNRSTHSHRLRSDTCTALLRHAIAHVDQIIVAGKRCMTGAIGRHRAAFQLHLLALAQRGLVANAFDKTSCVTRKLACSTFHVAPHCIALPGPGFLRVFQNALVVGQLRLHCGKIRRVAVEHLHQLPALADDLQVLPRCAVALRFFDRIDLRLAPRVFAVFQRCVHRFSGFEENGIGLHQRCVQCAQALAVVA